MYKRRNWLSLVSVLVIVSLLLAACGGAPPAGAPAADDAAPTAAAAEEAPAEEAAADAEAPLGASLIGEIEGPKIIVDVAAFPSEFAEAPTLAEQVAAGSLPALEERLPVREDLLVIEPVHEIGKYGGT